MKHRTNKRKLRTCRYQKQVATQNGTGLISGIASLLVAEKTGLLNRIKNAMPNSDDNARPSFIGERHALLKLKNPNGVAVASYMGPGTHIQERIARGDPPRTLSDKTAQAHDLRYFKAKTADDIRIADKTMIASLKRIKANNSDSRFNIAQGQKLIQLKMKLEDKGIFNKGSFGELKQSMNRVMTPAMNEKLNELKQEGFGIVQKPVDPIELLRKRMLKYAKSH